MKAIKTTIMAALLLCFVTIQTAEAKIDGTDYRPTIELYKPSPEASQQAMKEFDVEYSFEANEVLYSMIMFILSQDPNVTVSEESLAEQAAAEPYLNIELLQTALSTPNDSK